LTLTPRHDEQLTIGEAFQALHKFIEAWWIRDGKTSDDALWLYVATTLGRTQAGDPVPSDPAMWQDFLDAVDQAKRDPFSFDRKA